MEPNSEDLLDVSKLRNDPVWRRSAQIELKVIDSGLLCCDMLYRLIDYAIGTLSTTRRTRGKQLHFIILFFPSVTICYETLRFTFSVN